MDESSEQDPQSHKESKAISQLKDLISQYKKNAKDEVKASSITNEIIKLLLPNDNKDAGEKLRAELVFNPALMVELIKINIFPGDYITSKKHGSIAGIDSKVCIAMLELDDTGEFLKTYYGQLASRQDVLSYIRSNPYALKLLNGEQLFDVAKRDETFIKQLFQDTSLFLKLSDEYKGSILLACVNENKNIIPDSFFDKELFKSISSDVLAKVLFKITDPGSLIKIIKINDRVNLPINYLLGVVSKYDNQEVTHCFVKYLEANLKALSNEEIRKIFMATPASDIMKVILADRVALESLKNHDVETMFMLRKDLRQMIVDDVALSSKVQVRSIINLLITDAALAKYVFTDAQDKHKGNVIERIQKSASGKELLSLVIACPEHVNLFINKKNLKLFSDGELHFLRAHTKNNLEVKVLEKINKKIGEHKKPDKPKTKEEKSPSDIDLSQRMLIQHMNQLYVKLTKDKYEPFLNKDGVCAGLVTEWLAKLSKNHTCNEFNQKLATCLASKSLSGASFIFRVNHAYVKTNAEESKVLESSNNTIEIKLKHELGEFKAKPDTATASSELAKLFATLSANGDCYLHISKPGHAMGIAIKKNDSGQKEVMFYDPNNPKGAVDIGMVSLEQSAKVIIDYLSANYQKVNNLELNIRTYQPQLYDSKQYFQKRL